MLAYNSYRNEDPLYMMIEHLRHELQKITEHKSFSDRDVVELSQRLDAYIVLAQRQKSRRPETGHNIPQAATH
ncbi:aspartyl-phosphate phosphatase Spo0E family protein [Saccharibacillus sp. CPCC 101409]|uniref:aspartyl-phosphate phosphatase Spo0E family protein n=1 Tax=Saccharibacillus sp. CPCC 101409 TaxID=3058041 RepID=UPI002671DAAC|nr:aspartyl-phosphate phosphatase Spo0E family protein [Saccharibacillus sp. CPCC 101409]MDO3410154.1 aspartyl-phosphate phosphatase Spo0E family protein [Saccharibacillus sp. CPCC 101409]